MLPSMRNAEQLLRQQTVTFYGLNRGEARADGELFDMTNLSSALYPVLSVRPARKKLYQLEKPNGLCAAGEKLCWVDGTSFRVDGEHKGTVTDSPKTFARLGSYLLIFPDKAYYHLTKGEFGALEASWTGPAAFTHYSYDAEGDSAEAIFEGNALQTTGASFPFEAGEAVELSGSSVSANNKTSVIREIRDGGKLLVFSNNVFTEKTTETLTLRRKVPDMEHFCENENRLWGCKGNEIYACALGNPFRWYNLEGLSTDSYAVTVGSDGAFTGATAYLGYAIFFKEDAIHKIYGSKPSNFQVMTSAVGGVTEGGAATTATANETLFYLGRNGVQSYTGGVPVSISGAFGGERFETGVAGSDGLKYYLSCKSAAGWALYCYDALRGLWHKEDDTHVLGFACVHGILSLLDATDNAVYALSGGEEAVSWMLDTGDIYEGSPDKKDVVRLQARLELAEGADAIAEIQYDGDGVWHTVRTIAAGRKRSCVLPLIPRRCDHYRLRLSGHGDVRLYGITRSYCTGSER